MQELKRVLLDIRFVSMFFLILAVNGLLFYSEIIPDEEIKVYNEELYGKDFELGLKIISQKVYEEYKDMDLQIALKKLQEEMDILNYPYSSDYEKNMEYAVLADLYTSYSYIDSYHTYIADILEQADKLMMDEGSFSHDSYAGRNIQKTKKDFEKIKDVMPEYGTQDAFQAISNYNLSDFIMLILVITAVVVILDERKQGLWELIYSMPGGRRSLAAKRAGVMAVVSFLSAASLYLENIIIAGVYYSGYGDVFRPIQSMEICSKVTMKINVLEFMYLSFFWKFVIAFLTGVFILILVLSLKGHMQVLGVMGVFFVAEYIAYYHIDVHSGFSAFKYVNLFAWMDAEWCIRNYLNLNVLGYPVSIYTMMSTVSLVLLTMLCILLIYLGKQRPFGIRDSKLKTYKIKPYRYENMFITEVYKQTVIQKMWILIVFSILISVYRYDGEEVYYDYKGTLYNAYMEQISGPVTMEKKEYLEKEISIWREKYDEQVDLLNQENINGIALQNIEAKMKQFQTAIDCTTSLLEYVNKQMEYAKTGENVRIVNNTGYNHYIGEAATERNSLDCLLELIFITIMASVLFSSENVQNSGCVIKSTKNGRGKFQRCKYGVLFIEEVMICIPVMLSTLLGINEKYYLSNGNASVHSLELAEKFPFEISITAAIVLMIVVSMSVLYLIAVIITFIAKKIHNVTASIIVNITIFVIPAVLVYMGIYQMSLK